MGENGSSVLFNRLAHIVVITVQNHMSMRSLRLQNNTLSRTPGYGKYFTHFFFVLINRIFIFCFYCGFSAIEYRYVDDIVDHCN